MPSKYIARASIPDPERFKAHLAAVYARDAIDGVPIATGKGSGSALLRRAVECGALWAASGATKAIVALPQTTATTDADRLKAAMARQGLGNTALGNLIGVSRDVVKNAVRGLAMNKVLRAWLAEQEREAAR